MGAWKYTATLSPRRVSSKVSTTVRYGGSWTTVSATKYLGDTADRSSSSSASATYTVYGRNVAWVGSIGPGLGSARVYFDGVYVKTLNLSAATPAEARVLYTRRWTALATHRLTIKPTGSGAIYVDGFARFR